MSQRVDKTGRIHQTDLLGLSRLAIDGTVRLTDLVEAMQDAITGSPAFVGTPARWPARSISGLVYDSIRKVTGLVGGGLDAVLTPLMPVPGESRSTPSARLRWLC